MEYTSNSYRRLTNIDDDPTVDDSTTYTPVHPIPAGIASKPHRKPMLRGGDIFSDAEMVVVEEGDAGKCCAPSRRHFSKLLGIRAFLVVVCFYVVAFVTVEMYIVAVITTIEKRFGFRSSSSGMLLSAKEIAYVLVVTPSSHFANKWHRPRFLSLMAVLGAFGSALSALPHFLFDSPFHLVQPNTTQISADYKVNSYLCLTQSKETTPGSAHVNMSVTGNLTDTDPCELNAQTVAHNDGAYAIFALSSVVIGFAIAPMIALTTTYVDDSVGPVKNALYLAFMNMMRPLGPVVAFLMGALFTSFHESMEDPGYDTTDRRWIGAWWVGYLSNPCILLLAAIFISVFPKSIPRDVEVDEKAIELKQEKINKKNKEKSLAAVGLLAGVGRLLCNPVYMLLMLGGCFSSFVVSGMFPFMPKYIEVQFHLSASVANTLTGMVGALLAGVGVLLGGVLSSCMKWKPAQSAFFIFITDILFVAAILIMMTVTCPNVTYVGTPHLPTTNVTCSAACGCSVNDFYPVCGADGMTYTSPCLAGCQTLYSNQTYGDCGCLSDGVTAMPGSCDSGCQMWMVYMAVLAVGAVIGMMASVPATTICLRCVEERDRSLALGFTGTVISLASFVPGPMLYGFIIDSTCLNWQETCGDTGYCHLYDTDQFRFRLHGITAILKGIAGIFYLLVWVAMRREKKKLTFSTIVSGNVQADSMSESSESAL